MPAKEKYLSSSWQRFLKITAGILGGYIASASIHLFVAVLLRQREIVLVTSTFTLFIVWAILMVLSFFAQNGWKVWGIYLAITIVLTSLAYFFK